jgi:hypothetical protein
MIRLAGSLIRAFAGVATAIFLYLFYKKQP